LYGTTASGGLYGFGTIFKCAPATIGGGVCGNYTIIYNFQGAPDGMSPSAPLIYDGTLTTPALYGTTSNYGSLGGGTLFELTLPTSGGGSFTTLHSFVSIANTLSTGGANPSGDLAVQGSAVFGTTWQGGDSTSQTFGSGTIFKYSQTSGIGTFAVERAFEGLGDGENPFGGVLYHVSSSGTYLYGTTHAAGCATGTISGTTTCGTPAGTPGSGTIFSYSLP